MDISAAAIAVARSNARRHAVSALVRFVNADLLSCFAERPIFDLIVSNPPYVAQAAVRALAEGILYETFRWGAGVFTVTPLDEEEPIEDAGENGDEGPGA